MPCSSRALMRVASVKRGGGSVKCWVGLTSRTLVRSSSLSVRQATGGPLLLVVLGAVVAALGVDPGEALEQGARRAGPQLVGPVGQVDRRGLELLGRHLRGQGALPDEPVQAQLLGLEGVRQRVRVAPEGGRPDRLVGLLGALRLGLVDPALGHREGVAVAVGDDLAGLAHGHAGDGRRVGPHVGDEADMAVRRLDALVQALGDGHRALGAERQLAAGLLLEGRGRERRRRRALLGADRDLAHDRAWCRAGRPRGARRWPRR